MSQIVETLINLGLGKPAELKRANTPFTGTVLLGGGANADCLPTVAAFCRRQNLSLCRPVSASGASAEAIEGIGTWATSEDQPGDKLQALVFDGTGIEDTRDLNLAYDFFKPALKSLSSCGRIIILSRPHRDQATPEAAACQRALEGLARSLAKESGKRGTTAQIVTVEAGAEGALEGPLGFLLSNRSAYVNAQVFRVSNADLPATDTASPLAGKTALVTGASRGIGAAIASTLARDGATIIGLDVEPLKTDLEALMSKLGGQSLIADITADDTPAKVLEIAKARGGLDIVVHNAGITRDKTLANMPEHWWDLTLDINLGAALRLNSALFEAEALNRGGRIVGVSSMNGIAGQRGQSNYAASKAGVIGYVEQMAPQLKERGITINAVAPGFIETQMTAAIPVMTREVGRRLNSLSQGGQPEDVAETIAFFASPQAAGITGNIIRVCGQSWLGA
ncbi:3-oxoacyl-[acyl-carrier protein] reductase [Litorivivens lipolytica]|uniref:3-oxoacyl-[acyl-carrier protein] reductase n=1 Tax=Litorivivens lipolytica TaxID=1524264 RepID=A0A7W4Z533_9GAMM|nr:3-oxoacyl-ACP reductase [Litorivivens lipolytica]MBB3046803.1 3-oxoacyl-[acyl-carrier protein] reductase [Litorivivens lipolytica]